MRTRALLVLSVVLTGCVTPREYGNVRRLMAYPGFQDAANAAPGVMVEAMDTIDRLERQLANCP